VPPVVGPLFGDTDVTVGGGTTYVKSDAPVPVPPGVVTCTSTAPAACAGVTALIEVALVTVNRAAVPPNETAVAPVNCLPVMVTLVPPAVDPLSGDTAVTVGAGTT
jgi:hypothetical protein